MKTGISTASLFMRQTTEDALVTIKSMGAECVEVFLQSFIEYRPEFSKRIAPLTDGIEVCAVHTITTQFEPQIFSPSRLVRGDAFYWLDQVMRSAQLLKCGAYTFHGYIDKHGSKTVAPGAQDYLAQAVDFCARYGVRLCLENVSWSTYSRAGYFKLFKDRIPSLTGVLDLKQARRSGYSYKSYIKDMAGSISHVHFSDVDKSGKLCLPGKGITDFDDVLKRLKDAGFDGCILIEAYPEDFADVAELKASFEFIKEKVDKLK